MNYRKFGKTDLIVSETGFGAWAIGGAAMSNGMAIGWGKTDDRESVKALETAFEKGINFYDTADFYGIGHSEDLIGKTFGNSDKVFIASKVGQKPGKIKPVDVDYSKAYLLSACNASLKRLQRDSIDYYQLHIANLEHLQQGECIEAMEQLKMEGKIRYWGISIFTFNPFPEAEFILNNNLGHGFQLVFNIINQKAYPLMHRMKEQGYGIIARMPLQFGLLAGKFNTQSQFDEMDHRSFRLTPEIIEKANQLLEPAWLMAEKHNISKAQLALSYILSYPEISTVIPGIRTPEQAKMNTKPFTQLSHEEKIFLHSLYENKLQELLTLMQKQG